MALTDLLKHLFLPGAASLLFGLLRVLAYMPFRDDFVVFGSLHKSGNNSWFLLYIVNIFFVANLNAAQALGHVKEWVLKK